MARQSLEGAVFLHWLLLFNLKPKYMKDKYTIPTRKQLVEFANVFIKSYIVAKRLATDALNALKNSDVQRTYKCKSIFLYLHVRNACINHNKRPKKIVAIQ